MDLHDLPRLNLPPYGAQLRAAAGGAVQIHDAVRARWVALTPEEWVRQHFVNMLTTQLGYSPFRIANETAIAVNGRRRRIDTVIFSPNSRPLMLIEYKAPHIPITQRVIDQVARYNIVCMAPWLAVSNGLRTVCLHFHTFGDTLNPPQVSFVDTFPSYNQLMEEQK